ncbi:MAG: NAD(P)-dependent glycerol-3-phosphate dehydrogenase [Gammaproteobacteria bacterium]|nr:NAD(P)-dependent glycerol-3-phosphate dehydrogenase [Gammaproteobacteria bacterium]MBD3776254.1 NAD(P)-dependent glycerol-3-phosphate dehydrogenase [Thiotrichales bacterium]
MTATMPIAVIGAGAWGTALAIHLARGGHVVRLWTHSAEQAKKLRTQRENTAYLKGIHFPDNLQVSAQLDEVLVGAQAVLVVVPSHVFRETLQRIQTCQPEGLAHFAWATKGFEPQNALLLHQVAKSVLGEAQPMAVLSGPTFADEVAKGLPTAMVSASENQAEAQFWADLFHFGNFRMYTQNDMVGVEIGGAYKNIMAIATGMSDGLHLGANARAALVARGMAEMMRLGQALGANPETLMGLAGLGDLVLTCTDDLSRNRRFGLQLAKNPGQAEAVMASIGQVVEGVKAVQAVKQIAERHYLDLPIMQQVYRIVNNECSPADAVRELMARDGKAEITL